MTATRDLIADARAAFAALADDELVDAGIHRRGEFFKPVVCYPAMDQLPPASVGELVGDAPTLAEPAGVYVHIPFCLSRCLYCHWVIRLHADEEEIARYLDALEHELRSYCQLFGRQRIRTSSILVGGGTPSLLPPKLLERFLGLLERYLDLEDGAQYSFEAEPSTLLGPVGDDRLRLLVDHGVSRVSMGVQSFRDDLLRLNARQHTTVDALEAISRMRQVGIPSISIDLIYGLPGETLENWLQTMQTAVTSGADAWQLYRLRIIPHGDRPGAVGAHFERNPGQYASVDDTLIMKTLGTLVSEEGGFHQHYTRIFARGPEHISRYLYDVNVLLRDVLGVGISAWGNVGPSYLLNVGESFERYYRMIDDGLLPVDRGLLRDVDEETRHCLILPLKNDHLDVSAFHERTGHWPRDLFGPTIDRLLGLDLVAEDARTLRLTDRGRFYADQVVTQFASERYRPVTKPWPDGASRT